jgi:hypothetical protein
MAPRSKPVLGGGGGAFSLLCSGHPTLSPGIRRLVRKVHNTLQRRSVAATPPLPKQHHGSALDKHKELTLKLLGLHMLG